MQHKYEHGEVLYFVRMHHDIGCSSVQILAAVHAFTRVAQVLPSDTITNASISHMKIYKKNYTKLIFIPVVFVLVSLYSAPILNWCLFPPHPIYMKLIKRIYKYYYYKVCMQLCLTPCSHIIIYVFVFTCILQSCMQILIFVHYILITLQCATQSDACIYYELN